MVEALSFLAIMAAGLVMIGWLADAVSYKRVGGLWFWKVGRLGGSIYVSK